MLLSNNNHYRNHLLEDHQIFLRLQLQLEFRVNFNKQINDNFTCNNNNIFIGQPSGNAPDLSLSFGKGTNRHTSAPASPAKSRESLLQRVQSLTGAARDQGASILGRKFHIQLKKATFPHTKIHFRCCCIKCNSSDIQQRSLFYFTRS